MSEAPDGSRGLVAGRAVGAGAPDGDSGAPDGDEGPAGEGASGFDGTASFTVAWSDGGTDIRASLVPAAGSVKGAGATAAGGVPVGGAGDAVAARPAGGVAVGATAGAAVVGAGGVAMRELAAAVAVVEAGGIGAVAGALAGGVVELVAVVAAVDPGSLAPAPAASTIAATPIKTGRPCARTTFPAPRFM